MNNQATKRLHRKGPARRNPADDAALARFYPDLPFVVLGLPKTANEIEHLLARPLDALLDSDFPYLARIVPKRVRADYEAVCLTLWWPRFCRDHWGGEGLDPLRPHVLELDRLRQRAEVGAGNLRLVKHEVTQYALRKRTLANEVWRKRTLYFGWKDEEQRIPYSRADFLRGGVGKHYSGK